VHINDIYTLNLFWSFPPVFIMRPIFVFHCYKYISILLLKYLYNLNVIFFIILIISIRLIWRVEFIKISSLEMCVGQCVGGVMTASVRCMLSVNYDKCQM